MSNLKFSIVIPAHNEERLIKQCLDSIRQADDAQRLVDEVIVVLNRCTDKTEEIATQWGAKTLVVDDVNLSIIRNVGIEASRNDWIITIDADSWMSANMLIEIEKKILSRQYIGGGVKIVPERTSFAIRLSFWLVLFPIQLNGLSIGLFWFEKKAFDAIEGFDLKLLVAEDMNFAGRLKKYGEKNQLKYGCIESAHIVTSCRKFDEFGDWFMLKIMFLEPMTMLNLIFKKQKKFADKYFYQVKR